MSSRLAKGLGLLAGMGLLGVGGDYGLHRWARSRLPEVGPQPLALPELRTTVALARVPEGTLVLREVSEDTVSGVLVAGSPLAAHTTHGLAGLQALRDAGPLVERPLSELMAPVHTPAPHLGAGNNFADHQDETRVTDEPGLFPKMAEPTAWDAEVPPATRLDYEVELCGVALEPIQPGQTGPLGFVLCNDFTDRWAMMASFRPGAPLGTTGFPDGKGRPGFLPTGPWLVIAEDPAAFAASVDLRLSVDGRLRQDASQSLAIWDHAQIVAHAFERCDWDFRYAGEAAPWPACEELPAGTLVLGGTPGGVAFRITNVWAGWRYLDPGSVVVSEGTGLGRLVNRVAGEPTRPPPGEPAGGR